MQNIPAKDLCRGRWRVLLPKMGVDARYLTGRHGPCPVCGGTDRFRWDDKDGTGSFFCSGCGPGDGFMLAERVTGKSFRELWLLVKDTIGTSPMPEPKKPDDPKAQKKAMQAVWRACEPPSAHSPVGLYQTQRLGRLWPSKSILEHKGLKHPHDGQIYPAMVARISDPSDKGVNLHITYLTRDGQKAPVDLQKRVMAGSLPEGSAIRIWPSDKFMGIAEGIETAMSAAILYKCPVWAAVSGPMLAKWVPPEGTRDVVIFADNDSNYAGQSSAYVLANRLVQRFGMRVDVQVPPERDTDWNDVLKKEKGA